MYYFKYLKIELNLSTLINMSTFEMHISVLIKTQFTKIKFIIQKCIVISQFMSRSNVISILKIY